MRKSLIFCSILLAFGLTACSSSTTTGLTPVTSGSTVSKTVPNFSQFAWLYDFTAKGLNYPSGPLTVGPQANNVFGTTSEAGTYSSKGNGVYEITDTSSTPAIQTLYTFPQGYTTPRSGVTVNPDGDMYGTSATGGSSSGCGGFTGCGYIFKLKKSSSGVWSEAWTHNFAGNGDLDGNPDGPPLVYNGKVYGTVIGYNACGGIYQINPDGSGYSVVYGFSGIQFCHPSGQLAVDSSGNLYGTAELGARGGCCGAVWELKNTTSGYSFTVVHSFTSSNGDGAYPTSGVRLVGQDLYGTTNYGGSLAGSCSYISTFDFGCGTVFAFFPGLNGGWLESIIHEFDNKVAPISGLVANGTTLYGVTEAGGTGSCYMGYGKGCGLIFSVSSGTYTKLHEFAGAPGDGGNPIYATPAVTSSGLVFGATQIGGSSGCNCGAAFELPTNYAKAHKHR